MDREILTNLFTLAEITAAINLAYMNLPATRFSERLKSFTRQIVEPYRWRMSDELDLELWQGVAKHPKYKEVYGIGELGELGYPPPDATEEQIKTSAPSRPTGNDVLDFAQSSLVNLESSFAKLFIIPTDTYKRTADQIISTVCFTLSMTVIIYITLAVFIKAESASNLNWLLMLVLSGLSIPVVFSKAPTWMKSILFSLSFLSCICLFYIWNIGFPIYDYVFTLRGLLFFIILFSLTCPIFLVISAHRQVPEYEGKVTTTVETLFADFHNMQGTEVSD